MKKILQRIATTLVVAGGLCGFGIGAAHAVGADIETEQGSGYVEKPSKISISSQCVAGTPQISVTETELKFHFSLLVKVKITGELKRPHFAAPFLKVRVNNSYNCRWVPANPTIEHFTFKDEEGNPKVTLGSTQRFDCSSELDITRASQLDDSLVSVEVLGRETRSGSWELIAQVAPHLTSRMPEYQVTLAGKPLLEKPVTSGDANMTIPVPDAKAGQTVSVIATGPSGSDVVSNLTLVESDLCPPQPHNDDPKPEPSPGEEEEEGEPEDPEPSPTLSVTETPRTSPTPESSGRPTSEPSPTPSATPTLTVTPTPHASGMPARELPATGAAHGSQTAFLAALLVLLGMGGVLGARRRWR